MSGNKKDLSREEMRQYLEGTLKGSAAHKVERYLLENPFAKEALEGFEGFDQPIIDQDLEALRARIVTKVRGKRRAYYMAAAVALLVVAISSWWWLRGEVHDEQLAYQQPVKAEDLELPMVEEEVPPEDLQMTDKPEPREEVLPPVSQEEVTTANSNSPKRAQQQRAKLDVKVVTEGPPMRLARVVADLEEEPAPVMEEVVVETTTLERMKVDLDHALAMEDAEVFDDSAVISDVLQGQVAGVVVTGERTKKNEAMTRSVVKVRGSASLPANVPMAADMDRVIAGTITGEDGQGLPGVSVVVEGTTVGVISDLEGNYSIAARDGVSLRFSFIGMVSKEVAIGESDTVHVQLEADVAALSEVVVIGYGEEKASAINYQSARPVNGFKAYKAYLKDNLKYPDEAREKGREGKVTLKVAIGADGGIAMIEVKKGIGYGCDEEAIRLVREGPPWNPAIKDDRDVASTVKVKVVFALPDP